MDGGAGRGFKESQATSAATKMPATASHCHAVRVLAAGVTATGCSMGARLAGASTGFSTGPSTGAMKR